MINGGVSHWWHEIELPERRQPLPGGISVDVAIVGGGYTGLWTAYYLKQAKPDLRVAVIEQQHCGYGASGRNGGWLTNTITGGRTQYLESHGRDAVNRFQREMNNTVAEVIRVAEAEGIDADIKKGGNFEVAYTPAQQRRLEAFVAAEAEFPHTDFEQLGPAEAKARINIAGTTGAAWHPHAARIQPAKLVRGLAVACENWVLKFMSKPGLVRFSRGV